MSEKLKATAAGQPDSELTKLKAVWRRLPDDARAYWSSQFASEVSQVKTRAELLTKFKINLRFDKQLNQFRSWAQDQEERDARAERMQENERRLKSEHPDWTLEEVRAEVLRQSYLETLATGNFKLGLAARKSDIAEQALKFDQEKFKEGLLTKLESGLAELATHIKSNPKAQAAYEALKAEVKIATK